MARKFASPSRAAAPRVAQGRALVRLLATHTHAGRDYAPGEVLEVSATDADWIVQQGVGERIDIADASENLPGG